MSNDVAGVAQKLTEIVARMPGRRILLSTLGLMLQQQLPGFSPKQYGHATLKELLRALPVLLTPGEHPGQWWLTLDDASVSGDGSPTVAAHDKLLPRVWDRIVDFDPGVEAWFDLEKEGLADDPAAVRVEPDRYLAMPRFPLGLQVALARAWCVTQAETHRADLLASLGDDRSLEAFLAEATRVDLRTAWNHHRGRIIADEVRVWAERHGIPLTALFAPRRTRPTRAAKPSARPSQAMMFVPIDEYRQFLHRTIDAMTADELRSIAIPGRFLVNFT